MNANQLRNTPISTQSRRELKRHLELQFANIFALVGAENPEGGQPRYVISIRGDGAKRITPQQVESFMRRFDVRGFVQR